jgi:hypothetical protein
MSNTSDNAAGQHHFVRRIDVIEARLQAAARRARALVSDSGVRDEPREDPVHRLEAIENTLKALEDHLRKIEIDMRVKESPPESLGSISQFSTGLHFPGLG